ncbi:MAG: FAD-dependent oxidoreductase [Giesbergeria sp.]|nr:FAD-dependent oxidoreductase [Giesbergeria sp.]
MTETNATTGTAGTAGRAAAPGTAPLRQLVLLGGGHAHLGVLADLAKRPLPGWQVTLVTPYRRQIYSGMLPGWVAGHYRLGECAVALDTLAGRAGALLHTSAGTALDLQHNTLHCADGTQLPFDRLSIDTGPVAALDELPGAAEHALPVRPIEGFVAAWPGVVQRIASQRQRFELVVLGAGAAGVELALAIHHRAMVQGWSHLHLTLVGGSAEPLDGVAPGAGRRVAKLLAQRGIQWVGNRRAARVDAGQLVFADGGAPLLFDACLAVTGAAAPAWPAASGLDTDARGFIRVKRTLQSTSHPQVTAAGDIAAYADARPKSGVFAVRAGPVLAQNLRALCTGQPPADWTPQQRALYLVSTGNHRAIAAWGRWAWNGAWVWRWKERIDRGFVARFGADDAMGQPANATVRSST